jgi:hypothetical protein
VTAGRQFIVERAGWCCEYCRSPERFATHSFALEHIIPRSRGGASTQDNLALSCQGCNNHKYTKVDARDPASGETVPLFHPRQQRWRDHFAWNEDTTIVIGLTPTGRATVEALRLNRPQIVNLRRALSRIGEHPPPEPAEEPAADPPTPGSEHSA